MWFCSGGSSGGAEIGAWPEGLFGVGNAKVEAQEAAAAAAFGARVATGGADEAAESARDGAQHAAATPRGHSGTRVPSAAHRARPPRGSGTISFVFIWLQRLMISTLSVLKHFLPYTSW